MQPASNFALFIPIIMGIFFILVGGACLVISLVSRRKVQTAQQWHSTTGRVTAASIKTHTSRDSDGDVSTSYQPVVEYEYEALNTTYQGSRVAFGASSYGRREAEDVLNRFSPGEQVTVFYDPQDPGEAVLLREAKGNTVFLIVGIVFLVLGLVALCIGGILAFRAMNLF